MKKFSFRLQTVLEIREKTLDDKRKEMAVVAARLNEQIEILENIKTRQNNIKDSLMQIYNNGSQLDITEVVNYKEFLGRLINEQKKQELLVEQFKKVFAIKQREVTEALKQVKILEKLKETQENKFYKEIEYNEAKELDDIVSTRFRKATV